MNTLLWPLAWAWESVYQTRRFFYHYGFWEQESVSVPIVSVGSLSFGGAGKTPFTIWLAKYCNQKEKKVMILTRGYKGKLEHAHGILKTGRRLGYNPFEFGDEALLLIRQLKDASVVVGKKRANNLKFYFEKEQPNIVLLDDGHQHLNLKRDYNIVLFDAMMPLASYRVAPLGYLREGLTALRDADFIIIGRCDQVEPERLEALKSFIRTYVADKTPFAEVRYQAQGFYNFHYQRELSISEIAGRKVICMAAIASPDSFFKMVEDFGAQVIARHSYPDHYFFSSNELKEIMRQAIEEDALIIVTEKDFVKLRRLSDDKRLLYLGIDVDFMSGKESLEKVVSKILDGTLRR